MIHWYIQNTFIISDIHIVFISNVDKDMDVHILRKKMTQLIGQKQNKIRYVSDKNKTHLTITTIKTGVDIMVLASILGLSLSKKVSTEKYSNLFGLVLLY